MAEEPTVDVKVAGLRLVLAFEKQLHFLMLFKE